MRIYIADPRPRMTVTLESGPQIRVNPERNVVTLVNASGPQGPAGRDGIDGSSLGSYTHVQATSNIIWTVQHGLGFNPSPTVFDTDGNLVFGWNAAWPTQSVLVLTFPEALSGIAHIS